MYHTKLLKLNCTDKLKALINFWNSFCEIKLHEINVKVG